MLAIYLTFTMFEPVKFSLFDKICHRLFDCWSVSLQSWRSNKAKKDEMVKMNFISEYILMKHELLYASKFSNFFVVPNNTIHFVFNSIHVAVSAINLMYHLAKICSSIEQIICMILRAAVFRYSFKCLNVRSRSFKCSSRKDKQFQTSECEYKVLDYEFWSYKKQDNILLKLNDIKSTILKYILR